MSDDQADLLYSKLKKIHLRKNEFLLKANDDVNDLYYVHQGCLRSYIIDLEGKVRHQVVNDMPLGRSIQECLRIIDALQHFEEHGEVCPMDWQKGEDAMTADHQGVSDYLGNK